MQRKNETHRRQMCVTHLNRRQSPGCPVTGTAAILSTTDVRSPLLRMPCRCERGTTHRQPLSSVASSISVYLHAFVVT
jgi:hypothetical protein